APTPARGQSHPSGRLRHSDAQGRLRLDSWLLHRRPTRYFSAHGQSRGRLRRRTAAFLPATPMTPTATSRYETVLNSSRYERGYVGDAAMAQSARARPKLDDRETAA